MIQELIARQLETGFADFAGLRIEGSVPIKQDLINQVIAEVLANGLPSKTASAASEDTPNAPTAVTAGTSKLKLDRAALQGLVQQMVKRAEITAENGAITLHFEVER